MKGVFYGLVAAAVAVGAAVTEMAVGAEEAVRGRAAFGGELLIVPFILLFALLAYDMYESGALDIRTYLEDEDESEDDPDV